VSKPVDWTVGIPASSLIASGTQVSGYFPLDGAGAREVLYRIDGSKITSYIVYDDNGRAIKRVDVTGKVHAGVPTPHVVEYKHNKNPAGDVFVQAEKTVRPATIEEIP
jgi:filamentous hemagglutinin